MGRSTAMPRHCGGSAGPGSSGSLAAAGTECAQSCSSRRFRTVSFTTLGFALPPVAFIT